jgi:hypothetical protein
MEGAGVSDEKLTEFEMRTTAELARLNSELLRLSAENGKREAESLDLKQRLVEISDMIEKRSERTP